MKYETGDLEAYYAALPERGGYDSTCAMSIPKELYCKTTLDVACRRGKGVYKLAEQVGEHGKAIGVDWREGYVLEARADAAHAAEKAGVPVECIELHVAYPELLSEATGECVADFAYVNCVLNLFFDPVEALRSMFRALKPGGLLVCDTVLATGPRDKEVVAKARALGNAVQAAPHRKDLMGWLASAGFDITTVDAYPGGKVEPAVDAQGELTVPVAASDEACGFVATDIRVFKADGIDRHSQRLVKDISEFR